MSEEADGIILFPTCDPQNNELIRSLCNGGFPIVCIDRHPQGVPCDSVQSDNYAATYAALQAISEAGHSRIACFCDYEEPVSSTGDRVRAYRDLLEVVGGDQRADFHAFPYLAPDSTAEFRQMVDMVREALSVSFDGPHPPTAVFCSREHYAGAVIEACAELSISVPKDLTVLAFVDRPSYMLGLPESVQKIRQDISMMGQIAAERILRRVAGDPLEAERILVPALTSSPNGSSEEVVAASEAKASA
jgi:LacI family transcriptional regulator